MLIWGTTLLKITDKLELISDIDMYQIFKRGTRHGISYISQRHVKLTAITYHHMILANQPIIHMIIYANN